VHQIALYLFLGAPFHFFQFAFLYKRCFQQPSGGYAMSADQLTRRSRSPKQTTNAVTPIVSLEAPVVPTSGWGNQENNDSGAKHTQAHVSAPWQKAKEIVQTSVVKVKQKKKTWLEALSSLSPEEIRKRFLIETGRYIIFLALFTTSRCLLA
jgi:hypothetical protein